MSDREDFLSDYDPDYESEPEANDDLGQDFPEEEIDDMRKGPTPWQVICSVHGRVSLTREQYLEQLQQADARWKCICGATADWDDDNYEAHGAPIG